MPFLQWIHILLAVQPCTHSGRRSLATSNDPILSVEIRVPAHVDNLPQIYTRLEHFLQAFARALDHSPGPLFRDAVIAACMEIAANIILHAYPAPNAGHLLLRIRGHADRIEVELHDWGTEFVSPPTLTSLPGEGTEEDGREDGLGLFLVRQAMDEVHYQRTHQGVNQWRLVKRMAHQTPPHSSLH